MERLGSMAENRIDILMVSTFSNDYVMVKQQELDYCVSLLIQLGFELRKPI